MPTQQPPTFASAAASNGTGDGASGRSNVGSGDWSRPRVNGSHTFRRSSQLNTSVSGHTRDSSATVQSPSTGVYLPPHQIASQNRYAKDQLLGLYKTRSDSADDDVLSVLTENWAPGQASTASTSNWGRRDERDPNPGPEICWDSEGQTKPLNLSALTEEEKELFATSVNSLVKPPQPANKDGTQVVGLNGRKSSISQGTGTLAGRPGVRRRDTSDSFGGNPLASPTFQRGGRDENPLASPPPSLMRRRTDLKDAFGDVGKLDTSVDTKSPFGSLRRTTTNPLSAGLSGPSSPWGNEPQSAGGFGRMGSFGILDQPGTQADKKGGFGSLGSNSRFLKDLRGKDNEDSGKNRSSLGMLDRLAEESNPPSQRQSRLGNRGNDEGDLRTGSAALGGDDPTPEQDLPPFRERIQQHQQQHDTESSQQHITGSHLHEPMSPTDTNPYQSPEHERSGIERPHEVDEDTNETMSQGPPYQRRHNVEPPEHGSRPGSTAPPRNMTGLGSFGGGFGGLAGGWPGQNPMAQPGQGRSPFGGEPLFGSLGDLGTPGISGVFSPSGTAGAGAFGGTQRSKLGHLFNNPMQEQIRSQEPRQDFFGSIGFAGGPPRDTDSPARTSRNPVDDLFSPQSLNRGPAAISSPFGALDNPFGQSSQLPSAPGFAAIVGTPGISGHAPTWSSGSTLRQTPDIDPNQMPSAQKKTMVMPDRMRWVYKDPQGNVQGPFSGLEMHDWYKAGFFSPELLVRKTEEGEYEPLAQLIRRIGNSREPFLVPQIGIPHGEEMGGRPAPGISVAPTSTAGNVQPPFANSFPSFGTTLTADQQNALERRKQEEQYLMAQQKEFLQSRQQQMMRNPMGGFPTNAPSQQILHNQSSAQSLHSQPSFGSIAGAPFQSGPGQAGPIGGHDPFGVQRPQAGGFGPVGGMQSGMQQHREDELSDSFQRMGLARASQSPFAGFSAGSQDPNAVSQMLQDRGRLQQEQVEAMQRSQNQATDPRQGFDRLDEFHRLREGDQAPAGVIGRPSTHFQPDEADFELKQSIEHDEEPEDDLQSDMYEQTIRPEPVSMPSRDVTEVKTTMADDVPPAHSAWAAIEKPVPHAMDAPDHSSPPLPAPAAQRANQRVIETLATENRSRSQTPSVETPSSSLAPWAKETAETARGPSLKEIQDAEARQAAEREALMAARRREAAEQERLAQAALPEPAPGLPSTASWAASSTPASPGASAWAKPAATGKATVGTQKKTLAQIQKEEEARKNRAAAAATAAVANSLSSSVMGGKRYAELVGKTTQPSPIQTGASGVGGAWTMVGASGKTKAPGSATPSRAASGVLPTATPPTAIKKPAPAVRANTMQSASASANETVAQWARNAMGRGLNGGINAEEFVRNLMSFPLDTEIISDSIYASSGSLDGRRLAEEFVRRRKLADKGIVPEGSITSASAGVGSSSAAVNNNGGWNEVAKTKPAAAKEEPGYKVVPGKKKPNKR